LQAGQSAVTIASVDVAIGGVRSRVLTSGRADAPEAVVFVHGNPGPADDWPDLLIRAGELGRAIAPDMPGYGRPGTPEGFTDSVDGYAGYLAALLDQLRISRVHIVAHDFAGAWALAWAVRHPEALATATLINSGVAIGYRWHRYARIWRTPVAGEVFGDAGIDLLDDRWRRLVPGRRRDGTKVHLAVGEHDDIASWTRTWTRTRSIVTTT
jgi:pimeloyl-ACP methyl ester carboxylesterase